MAQKTKKRNGKLKIPLPFKEALSDFLKVKPPAKSAEAQSSKRK